MFTLAREERVSSVEFCKNASKTPNIYCRGVRNSQDDLWGSIKATLYVSVNPLFLESAASKINDFDP